MKTSYTKIHLTYQEQVVHLKDKNLTIMNADYAVNKLSHLKEEIETLLKLHPKVPTFNMGFPENWEELELWRG